LSLTIQHIQESLCRAHIQALAGMAGVIYEPTSSFDYGVDGRFQSVVIRGNRRISSGHPLEFQAKASINWELVDQAIVYDLEAKTYNDLASRSPAETTLILILLCLPKDQIEWHVSTSSETTLRHGCYWHIVSGEVTENVETKRIFIPTGNLLTPESLRMLLTAERARRESQVA
jgi:hypothetical protein